MEVISGMKSMIGEISEIKPENIGFKDIKTDRDYSFNKAKSFVENLFSKDNEHFYTDKKFRIDHTPVNSENGHWTGERGESKYIPSDQTEAGRAGKEKLAEYGMDGIEYKNGEPDYSKCSEATVKIDDMTFNRGRNFDQADEKLAEQWNKENKSDKNDWSSKDVEQYRHDNRLSWHERCDTETMDLVSRDIHGGDTSIFTHSGGVAECKARDGFNKGGRFDE